MKQWYEIKNANASEAEILIYDDIGFVVGAEKFINELEKIDAPTIHVRINSDGGEVFDSFAIYNALKRQDAKIVVHIDGLAASGASIIAVAGDEVRIAKNAFVMIHNAQGVTIGDQNDMQMMAGVLEKLSGAIVDMYVARTGQPRERIEKWMDETTWFTAAEAAATGFIDVIDEPNEAAPAEPPKNRAPQFLNKAIPRVRVQDKLQALGLAEMLTPTPAAATQELTMITLEQFKEFAAKTPDAVKTVAKELTEQADANGHARGKSEAEVKAKPKNATAAELKAAFPADRDFVMDRLDVDAPMTDHKLAHNDHLQKKLVKAEQRADEADKRLAEIDPALAGTHPVNTKPGSAGDDNNQPMTADRKRQLLSYAGHDLRETAAAK